MGCVIKVNIDEFAKIQNKTYLSSVIHCDTNSLILRPENQKTCCCFFLFFFFFLPACTAFVLMDYAGFLPLPRTHTAWWSFHPALSHKGTHCESGPKQTVPLCVNCVFVPGVVCPMTHGSAGQHTPEIGNQLLCHLSAPTVITSTAQGQGNTVLLLRRNICF